jgi:hypothetical protein
VVVVVVVEAAATAVAAVTATLGALFSLLKQHITYLYILIHSNAVTGLQTAKQRDRGSVPSGEQGFLVY